MAQRMHSLVAFCKYFYPCLLARVRQGVIIAIAALGTAVS